MSITVTLPDGTEKSLEAGATALDVARSIGEGLARASLAAKVNGELVDLTHKIETDAKVSLLTYRDAEGAKVLRHTAAHVLAMAVKRLYPGAVLEDGPATDNGFFYDIQMPEVVAPEDFPKIEAEMRKIVKAKIPLTRREMPRDEAMAFFGERGENFKLETIEEIPEGQTISVY